MKHLNLTNRLFAILGGNAALFASGFFYSPLITAAWIMLILTATALFADVILMLYFRNPFNVTRHTDRVLSLSDNNQVNIEIRNNSILSFNLQVIDELPVQLQRRDLEFSIKLGGGEKQRLIYDVRPTTRGEYRFGNVNLFATSRLRLAERRLTFDLGQMLPVYPSLIQMRKYSLTSLQRIARHHGLKKLRKIGHSYEFETIKNYVSGDDYRAINWKATGRQHKLMVNLYEDEKSQNVYSIIDKSRSMMLPFNGLSLMDYAINTSLVISGSALQKHDKAGLITFSDKIGSIIKAENKRDQLNRIVETLYREKERNSEADFELLYQAVNRLIRVRSLIFLYTNFDSPYMVQRALEIMRRINHHHLLVVVFFENSEADNYSRTPAENLREIYLKTIARKMIVGKQQIAGMLAQHKIQVILSKPEELSVNSVNKYLELKARGLI